MSTLKRTGELRRSELVRRTPLRAKAGLKSRSVLAKGAPKAKRYRSTGPVRGVVDLVYARDGGACVPCGRPLRGERGVGWSVHHRRPRRAGGDRRPEANLPANLMLTCGSGTTGCHGFIESNRATAIAYGWLLSANDIPAEVAVRTWWGKVLLDDEGRWTEVSS